MQRFWLFLLGAAVSLGQETAARTVAGIVVNGATGEPIRRALVTLIGVENQPKTFTGADGRFAFEGVKPGMGPHAPLFLSAQRPGFSGGQMLLASGDVRLSLLPDGKITGRALDLNGEAVEQLQIQLLQSQIVQGRRAWQLRASAMTDENGLFALPSLQAGHYILHTLNHTALATTVDAPAQIFPARYYPGAADLSSAQIIALAAGQDAVIDISLRPERAFVVSGTITGFPGNIGFTITDANGQQVDIGAAMLFPKDNKFSLEHIPAGSWTLFANANDDHGGTYSVHQDLTVNGTDITNLQIVAQRAEPIPVTVKHGPNAGAQVNLVPSLGGGWQSYFAQPSGPATQPGTDPSLSIQNVPPGRYRLVVEAFGQECLASASSGSTDLTREELLISPGSQPEPITISLANNCATLTGTLAPSGNQSGNGIALAVPLSPQGSAKLAPISPGKPFTLAGLSPGAYTIYAFSNLNDLEYANPEALRQYHGQQLDLQAGQAANVTLEMNMQEHP